MKYSKRLSIVLAIMVIIMAVGSVSIIAQDECDFAEETIRIGALVPLSSPGSVTGGISMQWAMGAAEDDINSPPKCGVEIDGMNYRIELLSYRHL